MLRSRTALLVLALLALLAAACGSDDDTTDAADGDTEAAAPAQDDDAASSDEADEGADDADETDDADSDDVAMAEGFPVTIESAGGTWTLDAAPERIVSLSPSATEILFAVGAGDQVTAVDAFSYYPEEAPVTDLSGFDPNVEAVIGFEPDLVIIATGGVPNFEHIPGHELITSSWDILDGTVKPESDVLVVDGTGRHAALSAADFCHHQDSSIRLVTIDSTLAAEQTYAEQVIWRKWARQINLPVQTEELLMSVRRQGNRLAATIRSELTSKESEITASQIVFDSGTYPADELFHALRQRSSNEGVTNLQNWVAGRGTETDKVTNPDAKFELHRIGDALSSRNIHAAVNDALRLCQTC